jgi:hypothetical protein
MALVLEIVEGNGAGQKSPLDSTLELGRDPGVSMQLMDAQVSRRHARIGPRGDGAAVEDLGSANGTYVNGQRIAAPREMQPGDTLRVGTTVLLLRSEQQVAAQPSAVVPMPAITAAAEVLEPVPDESLSSVFEVPDIPALRRQESPAAYVPAQAAGGTGGAGAGGGRAPVQGYGAPRLEGMVDARVKHQTSVAAFALLAIVALAVLIYFGAIR